SFFGGEPLLHSRLAEMIAMVVERDMGPALITNGWLLAAQVDKLAAAGLNTVYISIDAATIAKHEANRGLEGLGERIRTATSRMRQLGMTPLAQVTMSKLLGDYRQLAPLLRELGFDAVAFSYPQTARLGSSSLAWSSDSQLMSFTNAEMVAAFDSVDVLRAEFPVNNPSASVADMKRHRYAMDARPAWRTAIAIPASCSISPSRWATPSTICVKGACWTPPRHF